MEKISDRTRSLTDAELSVVLTGDEQTRRLNAEWRETDETTDVLSFPSQAPRPSDDLPVLLGDIVINLEYAERLVETRQHHRRVARQLGVEADALEWGLAEEVEFLLIHGLLHLTGFDHADPETERRMKAAERRLWKATHEGDFSGGNPDG